MKISEKLYNLRTAHGLSMVEFGRIAGASDVSINFWERGLRSPKVKYLRNICDRYGIDLATFLDESNDIYDGTRPENIIPLPSMRRVPLIGTMYYPPHLDKRKPLAGIIPPWYNEDAFRMYLLLP